MSEQEWRLVPCEPSDELLRSMAVRYDHGLGCDGYYDQSIFAQDGITHAMRLRGTMTTMRQLHEEVVGTGFAAVPPLPRATFDAMVERAARATFLMRNGSKTCWAWDSSGLDDEHPGARERYLKDAETALRAALPGLVVEGE